MKKIFILLLYIVVSCGCPQQREIEIQSEQITDSGTEITDIHIKEDIKIEETSDSIQIETLYYTFIYDKKRGYCSIKSQNSVSISNFVSEIVDEENNFFASNDSSYKRKIEIIKKSDDGRYEIIILNETKELPVNLRLHIFVKYQSKSVELALSAENRSDRTVRIKKIKPVVLRSRKGGGLFLGRNPSTHRILENGSNGFLDFYVRILPGDVKNDGHSSIFPFEMEGNSVSNWNHCVSDLTSGLTEMSGFLTFEKSVPMVNLSYEPDYSKKDELNRTGFSFFSLECPYLPVSFKIKPGITAYSETAYIDLISPSCQDALEEYSKRLAEFHNITLWNKKQDPETKEFCRVPNGWNSWSGGSSSGGYGTDINEQIILDNLEAMKREFKNFGVDWFQIDDGWEVDNGDWILNKNRFPDHGPIDSFEFIVSKIKDYKMKPGLWIAGLTAFKSSQLYQNHPDWFAPKLPYASNEYQILDFSKNETLDFVYQTFKKIKDYGFRWVKLDFSYWVIAASRLSDDNVTPVEGYRRGLHKVRDALQENVHLLNVSATGPSIGLADSVRITLDNMPVWDGKNSNLYDISNQGLKPTYATVARRYYYNQRVWINHPDLIFFRSMPEEKYPPLTLDEARAFLSMVGITGSIVKIGEKIVDMKPEWIDSVRRILPVFPINARPIDLIRREFPEIWAGRVEKMGLDEYYIMAIFNWGRNRDLTQNPYVEIEDRERDYHIEFPEIGIKENKDYLLYEFWDEKFYGVYKGGIDIKVPPHRAMVFAIREKKDTPQLLGTNRHILMGATEIDEYAFNKNTNQMKIKLLLSQSENPDTFFEHRIYLYIPDNFKIKTINIDNPDIKLSYEISKNTLNIKLLPRNNSTATILINFE